MAVFGRAQRTLPSGMCSNWRGTGLWTQLLAERHSRIVAVDASPEVIAINRARLQSGAVGHVLADLFHRFRPRPFDKSFGFWLSHVPAERFDAFWAVRSALKPDR
jgi:demethylmenaquinone methyltransferase/2-methoxy-6-polyprenyl-1,4-benzoquinol methylase